MSTILQQIYKDLIKKSNYCEDIEMTDLQAIPWSKLPVEQKKKYILHYMKNNNIEGHISEYTFKNISFNKEQKEITNLTYYKKK